MKKVLFTSTAIVAFAGAAAADVAITGSAEMGIVGGSGVDTEFFQDIDVNFKMSGETDNGLSFGAAVDLDEAGANLGEEDDDNGFAIFISGDFGTVTMGDTDGALDWSIVEGGNAGNPGSIADEETSYTGYAGSYLDGSGDGQIVRYDNSIGDFSFAVSIEQDDTSGDNRGLTNGGNGDMGYAVAVKGSFGDISWGLGYQKAAGADTDVIGAGVSYSANGLSAALSGWTGDAAGVDIDHINIGFGYSMDAFSIHANFSDNSVAGDGWGLAASYDLGGGLSAHAATNSDDDFSLGLAMSF